MHYKRTVVLALAIALFGHLVAAGRTLHEQATNTDASDIESRKLLQQYDTNAVFDRQAETISGASALIAQAVAAGAQPEATAAAATRGADYAGLATEDSMAGTSDTGARRLLQGSSVDKSVPTTAESSAVAAQTLVAGAQPDVRSLAMKAGASFLKLSTLDSQPWKAHPDLVRKRSMLQRDSVVSTDKPVESRSLLGTTSGVPGESAVAGVQHDVKSAALKAGADYLKLSTLDTQLLMPKEDLGARKRSLLQRSTDDESYRVQYSLNAASDVIDEAVESGANAAVSDRAAGRAVDYARLTTVQGAGPGLFDRHGDTADRN